MLLTNLAYGQYSPVTMVTFSLAFHAQYFTFIIILWMFSNKIQFKLDVFGGCQLLEYFYLSFQNKFLNTSEFYFWRPCKQRKYLHNKFDYVLVFPLMLTQFITVVSLLLLLVIVIYCLLWLREYPIPRPKSCSYYNRQCYLKAYMDSTWEKWHRNTRKYSISWA